MDTRKPARVASAACLLAAPLILAACGGGTTSSAGSSTGSGTSTGTSTPTTSQRTQAATQTAQSNPDCTSITPFYWEIGDPSGPLASASLGSSPPAADTQMKIASASKWFFGAYVLELRNGQPTAADIAALTMRSGYENLSYDSCIKLTASAQQSETVDQCFQQAHLLGGANSDFTAADVGRFYYNGAHFQKYADIDLGLGADTNATLAAALSAKIGTDVPIAYDSPQLAAGLTDSAAGYALFLRKILSGGLKMHDALGTNAVCTNPATCATAVYTPIPGTESWHYSLAHWVEDDPKVGDGAFSSPGAFGFYPWIDAAKTTYGVLARYSVGGNAATESVLCGRDIRKAWMTGTAVLASSTS